MAIAAYSYRVARNRAPHWTAPLVFRIHDYELTETELALFESTAQVERDGFIAFPGQSRANERRIFNLCEILLEWAIVEEFGVSRVRLGNDQGLTRAFWARKLFHRTRTNPLSVYAASVRSRKASLRACFPHDSVKFRVLGWRLLNVNYWKPGSAVKIATVREARITRVMVRCSEQSTSRLGGKPR